MARPLGLDYEREYRNFLNARAALKDRPQRDGAGLLTQAHYAQSIGVARETLSSNFAEIKERAEKKQIALQLRRVTLKALNKASEGLDSLTMGDEKTAGYHTAVAGKIAMAGADRLGYSPQVSLIQMQQVNNTQNIDLKVSLFSSEDKEDFQRMLGGDVSNEVDLEKADEETQE